MIKTLSFMSIALVLCVTAANAEEIMDTDKTVIFNAQQAHTASGSSMPPNEYRWSPTVEEVEMAETIILNKLLEKHPRIAKKFDTYMRQYSGVGDAEHQRIIYGNFFCDDMGMDWKTTEIAVDDGGDCFFFARVNLDTGECMRLVVNGDA